MVKCSHLWLVGEDKLDSLQNKKYKNAICLHCGTLKRIFVEDLSKEKYIQKGGRINTVNEYIKWLREKQEEYLEKGVNFAREEFTAELSKENVKYRV